MDEVWRGFDDTRFFDIAAHNDSQAGPAAFFRCLRADVKTGRFVGSAFFATGRLGRLTGDPLALFGVDPFLPEKFPRPSDDASHVLPMVRPRPAAGAELREAATVRVHDHAGQRTGTLVSAVWHAVMVAVALLGAAAVGVYDRTGGGAGTCVAVVPHAVAVFVTVSGFETELEHPEIKPASDNRTPKTVRGGGIGGNGEQITAVARFLQIAKVVDRVA